MSKETLREKRRRKNLTLAQVARRVGVSIASVSAWENGTRVPKEKHALRWSRALAGGAR